MQKQKFRLLKYLCYLLPGVGLLALIACSSSGTGRLGGIPTPTFAPGKVGQIMVQLFDAPGFIYPSVNGVPEWTLYGDGMLLFRRGADSTTGSGLLEAHLSSSQINQILDVVVNQHHYFSDTRTFYGRTIPDSGKTLLNVTANGQHRVVALGNEPGPNADFQTNDVFAIAQFLRGYKPAGAQEYIPTGVVLLAISTQTAASTPWPYSDIWLAQVATKECPLLMPGTCTHSAEQASFFSVAGTRGTKLLQQTGNLKTMSQNGLTFQVIIWPLMPDATDPPPSVLVAKTGGQLQEWPVSQIGN